MKEDKLQNQIVVWFSQVYPHLRGFLFENNNNPTSLKNAMYRRSMGMIRGVSDLTFINSKGKFCGIEIKGKDSEHSKAHIQEQLNWGENIVNAGGSYIMSSSSVDIKEFIMSDGANSNIKEIKTLLSNSESKVKF